MAKSSNESWPALIVGMSALLAAVGFAAFLFYLVIHGLIISYKASVLLAVIVFFVEPAPLVIGGMDFFFDVNLAQQIVEAIK